MHTPTLKGEIKLAFSSSMSDMPLDKKLLALSLGLFRLLGT